MQYSIAFELLMRLPWKIHPQIAPISQISLNFLRVEQTLEDGFCEVAGSHSMKTVRARARLPCVALA